MLTFKEETYVSVLRRREMDDTEDIVTVEYEIDGEMWEFYLTVDDDGVDLRGRMKGDEDEGFYLVQINNDGVALYPGLYGTGLPVVEDPDEWDTLRIVENY